MRAFFCAQLYTRSTGNVFFLLFPQLPIPRLIQLLPYFSYPVKCAWGLHAGAGKAIHKHVGRGWCLFSKLQTRQLSFDRLARGISIAGLNCSGPSAPFCADAMKSCVMTMVDKTFNESCSWQGQNFEPSSFSPLPVIRRCGNAFDIIFHADR